MTLYSVGYAAALISVGVAVLAAGLLRHMGYAEPSASRIKSVDGLRGYLALFVFFHHFVVANVHLRTGVWAPPNDAIFANFGPIGVTLFFFITAVLFYRRAGLARSPRDWGALYVSRLFRLAPMYWTVAVMLIVIAFVAGGGATGAPLANVKAVAKWLSLGILAGGTINGNPQTFVIVAGVTWTLRYEWLFYLSLPLVGLAIWMIPNRSARLSLAALCFGVVALVHPIVVFRISSRTAATFLLGIIASDIAEIKWAAMRLRTWAGTMLGVPCLAAAILLPLPSYDPLQELLLLGFFLPVVAGNGFGGILDHGLSRILGEISYSMYLLHGMLLYLALRALSTFGLLPDGILLWFLMPILGLVIVLVSAATYAKIERPGIALGKAVANRLSDRKRIPAAPPAAAPTI